MAPRVLFVDDEPEAVTHFAAFLSDQGYETVQATNPDEALAHGLLADLVVCDLRLGAHDGLGVIRALRAKRPNAKILVLTGHAAIDVLQAAIDLGVISFLTKPLGLVELLRVVDRCFGVKPGRIAIVPGSLQDALAPVLPFLGEIAPLDPADAPGLRSALREAAPTCVAVDIAVPNVVEILSLTVGKGLDCAVFLVCRDEDFERARTLLQQFRGVRCVNVTSAPTEILKALRARAMAGLATAHLLQELAQTHGRCQYAGPLRTRYYCTFTGRCPLGFDSELEPSIGIRGTVLQRCPRVRFTVPNPAVSAILSWRGVPTEERIHEYREAALRELQGGKSHLLINCHGLQAFHFNLFEVLADLRNLLACRPGGRIDLINLAPKLIEQAQRARDLTAGLHFHGPVMMEFGPETANGGVPHPVT